MTYSPQQIRGFQGKDKRISFLSIFSSLCNLHKGTETKPDFIQYEAFKITQEVFKKYPFPEDEKEKVLVPEPDHTDLEEKKSNEPEKERGTPF